MSTATTPPARDPAHREPPAPAAAPPADPVDQAALADFAARHGQAAFAPVLVLIPSYGEAENIEGVLAEIPDELCGLGVSVLVVVDGEHPDEEPGSTTRKVLGAGHHVCVAPVNRGQGAALRLGYRLAQEGGAKYVVTIDADGQYVPAEIPRLLEPIVAGEADFVSGSRRLGREETTDPVRGLGVRVFARLITLLTGARITDPANGLRAMRVEVPNSVTLTEPQYQASELLIGAIARGWRVGERPTTMRKRASGQSKKQTNFLYGLQFGRVVCQTAWRNRRRRGAR